MSPQGGKCCLLIVIGRPVGDFRRFAPPRDAAFGSPRNPTKGYCRGYHHRTLGVSPHQNPSAICIALGSPAAPTVHATNAATGLDSAAGGLPWNPTARRAPSRTPLSGGTHPGKS